MRARLAWLAAAAAFALGAGSVPADACTLLQPCTSGPSRPSGSSTPKTERWLLDAINDARAARGAGRVAWSQGLDELATVHARRMAKAARVFHNEPGLRARRAQTGETLGENVGVGTDLDDIHAAFMASSSHRHTLLGPFERVGLGIARRGAEVYVVEVFATDGAWGASAGAPHAAAEPRKARSAVNQRPAGHPVLVGRTDAPRAAAPLIASPTPAAPSGTVPWILAIGGGLAIGLLGAQRARRQRRRLAPWHDA